MNTGVPEVEMPQRKRRRDADMHKGAVEGEEPGAEPHGNPNAPGLDSEGLPASPVPVAQDRIGANVDDSEVSNADEAGRTSDAPREEVEPLD
jgi:hypothetical protein